MFELGREEVVELVVIISGHTSRNLVARHQQAVAHAQCVAAAELLHIARTYALERLAPESVAPGGLVILQIILFYHLKVHIKYEKRKNVAITLSIKDLKGLLVAA